MNNVTLLNGAGRMYTKLHRRLVTEMNVDDLRQSAVVFAPHQDDETLACGGTIIKKILAGAKVHLVFMTDGCRSHCGVISKEKLKTLRKQEAIDAAKVLGLDEGSISFLGCENGQLAIRHKDIQESVKDILFRTKPSQVYVPCCLENVPDHRAANRIVRTAIDETFLSPMIFEYPVWFWMHWPWISMPLTHPMRMMGFVYSTVTAGFGIRMISKFRSSVFIGDVLDRKRRALANHRSQMVRLIPGSRWPILSDVAHGEFIRCFFQNYEIFCRYQMNPVPQEDKCLAGDICGFGRTI